MFADDYQPTALNNLASNGFTNSVCGSVQSVPSIDLDTYWTPTVATYSPGQVMRAEISINAYHWGHFEFSLCPANNVVHDCPYKLNILRDLNYSHRPTLTNPQKAMLTNYGSWYSYDVQIPSNIPQGNYVFKWKYITGNSCSDRTYDPSVLQALGAP